jgi:hypothetical protein
MINDSKIIYITSPAGSGNTYLQSFINENAYVNVNIKSHNADDILENEYHICILRDPMSCISSAVERHDKLNKYKHLPDEQKIDLSDLYLVKKLIDEYSYQHLIFLNKIKNKKNVFFVTFENVINNTEQVFKKIISQLNLEINKDLPNSMNSDFIFEGMKISGLDARSPKEKSDNRKLIQELVKKNYLFIEIEKKYIEVLQSTEITL